MNHDFIKQKNNENFGKSKSYRTLNPCTPTKSKFHGAFLLPTPKIQYLWYPPDILMSEILGVYFCGLLA